MLKLKPELSSKNKHWISKHRYYELKYFCLQYPTWKKAYVALNDLLIHTSKFDDYFGGTNEPGDPTGKYASMKLYYSNLIDTIEQAAKEADSELYKYILRGVTEGLSYTYLRTKEGIPCSRDTYYERYRRFFWILSNARK